MQILLCAATEFEISSIIHSIDTFTSHNIKVSITGVGILASTYAIQKQVYKHNPDLIIQAGVAGILDKEIPLTEVVIVENESIGDLGVEEAGKHKTIFDLGFVNQNEFPFMNGKLKNNYPFHNLGLRIVDGVTVNEISSKEDKIQFYKQQFNAAVETMEGAALHYVGIMEKVSFLQIRSISNYAGERDKKNWKLNEAIKTLNEEVSRIISNL